VRTQGLVPATPSTGVTCTLVTMPGDGDDVLRIAFDASWSVNFIDDLQYEVQVCALPSPHARTRAHHRTPTN
jgi:hypothetical protein